MVKIVKVKKCHIYYDGMQLFSANTDCGIYFFIRAADDASETVFVGVPANKKQYSEALTKRLDISTLFSNPSGEYLVIKTNDELSEVFYAEASEEIPAYDFLPSQGLFIEEPTFSLEEYIFENFWSSFCNDYLWKHIPAALPTWAEAIPPLPNTNPLSRINGPMFCRNEFSWTSRKSAPTEIPQTAFTKEGANENLQFAA